MASWLFPLFQVIDWLLTLFLIVLLVRVTMSWLFAFEVVNPRNAIAWNVNRFVSALTDPLMKRVQRLLPPMGGIDLSPLIILIAIYLIQMYLWRIYAALL